MSLELAEGWKLHLCCVYSNCQSWVQSLKKHNNKRFPRPLSRNRGMRGAGSVLEDLPRRDWLSGQDLKPDMALRSVYPSPLLRWPQIHSHSSWWMDFVGLFVWKKVTLVQLSIIYLLPQIKPHNITGLLTNQDLLIIQ